MVYIFLADGFEECEALAPADILRRADIEVKLTGVLGKTATGSHGIKVECDIFPKSIDLKPNDVVVLPGGLPGTNYLKESPLVKETLLKANKLGCKIAAICAAPSVLGEMGLLKGKKATCFPGFEDKLTGADFVNEKVVVDGNIITGCGAGAAFDFGFKLLEEIDGNALRSEKMKKGMLYKA